MRLVNVIFFIAIAILLVMAAHVYTTNHDVLVQDMIIRGEGVKVQTVILISFLIGFILNFIWALIMEIRQAIKGLNASAATRLGRRLSEQVQDARDLMAHGLPKEAEAILRGILEQREDHSEAMTLLGDCLLREGDPQAAALQLAHACETHPDHAEPRYLLAEARQALRDPDGAAAVLRQLASDQPKQALRALRRLRALHLEAQRWDEALETHKRLAAQFPGELSQAERAQGMALQYQVGLQKVEADQFKEAAQTFQALLKEDPSFVPAYLYLGRCMILQDQEAQGIEIWLEGFRATSEGALLQEVEDYYIQLGLPENGIAVLRRVAATSEHEAMAKFFLGKMLYRLEILDEALDIFQEVKSQVVYSPMLFFFMAKIHARRGRSEAALNEYRQLLRNLGTLKLRFECAVCGHKTADYEDRCGSCGSWNASHFSFKESDLPDPVRPESGSWMLA
ncbi:MAG TPA: tetratricopeptide repeat protein [Holophagaceae bacterium]|nr:tetratricopeptide repeat protein [Holophagaceae bacterium]